jgi:hypothetical protein
VERTAEGQRFLARAYAKRVGGEEPRVPPCKAVRALRADA